MAVAVKRGRGRERTEPLPDSDLQVLNTVSRARAWTMTGLVTIALGATLVHRQVLAALAVTVTDSLGISNVKYGWLSSGLAAALLLGSFPMARLVQKVGPQIGLVITVAMTSTVIGLHAFAETFVSLLCLRMAMGVGAASSMPSATQTVHRVLPFKDRARGIGLLYLGNSLGSALCVPLAVWLESKYGWRGTFTRVALIGVVWIPVWMVVAYSGNIRAKDNDYLTRHPLQPQARLGLMELVKLPGILRGGLLVAAAAPVTLVMLIWAAKYLSHEHHVAQRDLGKYLFLPALMFGLGSLMFGELRARSAKTRTSARPPRVLVVQAALLCCTFALVPLMYGPGACIALSSMAMLGAGGLYTLATSDMLAHTPRQDVPSTTGFTTVVQSLIYIIASPIIGKCVEQFGNYDWVVFGAGLWVLPLTIVWLAEASFR